MKWYEIVLEAIRSLVRPVLSISFAWVILSLTLILAGKFADKGMADRLVDFVLATGGIIIGFWFASRQRSKE